MELLIVRHGPAEERSLWAETGWPDSERPLTKDGRRKARDAARGLAELVDGVDLVATSPWTRAAKTAAFVAAAFDAKVLALDALIPDRPLADAVAWLKDRREKRIALVGHEPHLSRLASFLMTGRETSVLTLKKSQALLLDLRSGAPGAARLSWSIPSKTLRKI